MPELPRIFVGSSVEGIGVAKAVQRNFEHDAEVTVWSQGVFEVSGVSVDDLRRRLRASDFSVYVFTPDDKTLSRGVEQASVRDNVILEVGMSVGVLGRERTYMLVPSDRPDLRIPSDLFGITPAMYNADRSDGNVLAAVGAACEGFRDSIRKLGALGQGGESNQPRLTSKDLQLSDADIVAVIKKAVRAETFDRKRSSGTLDLLAVERELNLPAGTCATHVPRAVREMGMQISGEPGTRFVDVYQGVTYI